jgi:hypothetical protein
MKLRRISAKRLASPNRDIPPVSYSSFGPRLNSNKPPQPKTQPPHDRVAGGRSQFLPVLQIDNRLAGVRVELRDFGHAPPNPFLEFRPQPGIDRLLQSLAHFGHRRRVPQHVLRAVVAVDRIQLHLVSRETPKNIIFRQLRA